MKEEEEVGQGKKDGAFGGKGGRWKGEGGEVVVSNKEGEEWEEGEEEDLDPVRRRLDAVGGVIVGAIVAAGGSDDEWKGGRKRLVSALFLVFGLGGERQ